jgi:hypothetical protein
MPPVIVLRSVARLEGLEPPAHSLEGCCSIRLSYRRLEEFLPFYRGLVNRKDRLATPARTSALGWPPGLASRAGPDLFLFFPPCDTKKLLKGNLDN